MYLDEVENIFTESHKKHEDKSFKRFNNERNQALKDISEKKAEKLATYSGNRKIWRDAVRSEFKKYDDDIDNNLRGKSIKISHAYYSPDDKGDIIYKIAQKEIKNIIDGNDLLRGTQEKMQSNLIKNGTNIHSNMNDASEEIKQKQEEEIKQKQEEENKKNIKKRGVILQDVKNMVDNSKKSDLDLMRDRMYDSQNKDIWKNEKVNFYVEIPVGGISYGSSNAWDGLLRLNNVYYPVELKNTNEKKNTNINLLLFIEEVNKLSELTNKVGYPIVISDPGLNYDSVRIDKIKTSVKYMSVEQIYNFLKKENLNDNYNDDVNLKKTKEYLRDKFEKMIKDEKKGNLQKWNNTKDLMDNLKEKLSSYLYRVKSMDREKELSLKTTSKHKVYTSDQFKKILSKENAYTFENKLSGSETMRLFRFLKFVFGVSGLRIVSPSKMGSK